MAINCPNIKSKEYIDLVKVVGEDSAYILWSEFDGNVPREYYNTFNQKQGNSTISFDQELHNKIESKLKQLYPEIKLEYSNNPAWVKGVNVFDQKAQLDNEVNYRLKAVDILLSDKAKQIFAKGEKAKWDLNKILTELQIPKDQKALLLDLGITDREQLALELASKYGFSVEVNTAKTNEEKQVIQRGDNEEFTFRGSIYEYKNGEYLKNDEIIDLIEYESAKHEAFTQPNTQYYSNLTVPGGTNYTENEISTLLITPSIKGHAQFSTDNGIGWFRSDDKDNSGITEISSEDKLESNYEYTWSAEQFSYNGSIYKIVTEAEPGLGSYDTYYKDNKTISEKEYREAFNNKPKKDFSKTRRILELQSDLFQKGRDREDLAADDINSHKIEGQKYRHKITGRIITQADLEYGNEPINLRDYEKVISTDISNSQNQFLQLLNKDNNWVTFFIKSIIQDSAKKGYEKVLFPKGETAAKIEGHETLANSIISKDRQIKELTDEIDIDSINDIKDKSFLFLDNKGETIEIKHLSSGKWEMQYMTGDKAFNVVEPTDEQIIRGYKRKNNEKLAQLEQEKANLKSQGIERLKPIEAFYEIKVGNILDKQFGKDNVKTITDEFGNQWREITINQARDLQDVLLQKNEADRIIGQANIEALSILIDAVNQKQDTLPHEYAHHYIAWYRNTPVVQEAIKKWGSEEALVQSIGEQSVKQKGEAWTWWKKFVNWLLGDLNKLSKLDKERLTKILTDVFLTRQDLNNLRSDNTYYDSTTFPEDIIKTQEDYTNQVGPVEIDEDAYEKERLVARMVREYQAIISHFNTIRINYPKLKNIKNKHIRTALDKDGHYIPQINSKNKRYIVNRYFRLNDETVKNKPYYPYNAGTALNNEKLKNLINADFGERVVAIDPKREVLIFTDRVDLGTSLEERFDERLKDFGLDSEEFDFSEPDDLKVDDVKKEKQVKAWEEVIYRKESVKKVLTRKLAEGVANAPEIKARINRIEAHISTLKEKKLDAEIENIATDDIKDINRRLYNIQADLEKDLNEDQLRDYISTLQELSAYIKGWSDINRILGTLNMTEELKAPILKLSAEFQEAYELYLVLLKASVANYASKVSYKKFVENDLYGVTADDNWLTSQLLGASMSDIELIKIAQDILNKAHSDIHNEQLNKKRELNNWIEKLKKATGLSNISDISKLFLQEDTNGKWNGNLIHYVGDKYWSKIKKLSEQAKASGNWKSYFDFLEENTYELLESEYNNWLTQKNSGKEIDYSKISKRRMSDGSIIFDEKDFLQQEILLNKFKEHKIAYENELINSGKYGPVTRNENGKLEFGVEELSLEFNRDMQLWNDVHSPWKEDPISKTTAFKKYRVFNKVDVKWQDPKYKRIKDNPVLYEFYEFLKDRINENDENLPYYKKQSNSLLHLAVNPVEDLIKNKAFGKTLGVLKEEFIKSFTKDVESPYEQSIEIAGKLYKSIPVGLLHAEVPIEKRNSNIFEILDAHTNLALSYKHKSEIEPVVTGIQDILDQMDAGIKTNINGQEVLKKNFVSDMIVRKKGGLSQAKKQLENLINAKLYGKVQVQDSTGKKVYVLSTGEKRVFSLAKTVDFINKFTFLKALAIPNLISPLSNVGIGLINNYIWAAAGQDFNDKTLALAYGKILPTIGASLNKTNRKETIKILTWIGRLKVIPNLNAAEYIDSQSWEELLTILQNKGEYINQGTAAIAYLLHNKLKDKNGKDVAIYDAFIAKDGELIWDTAKMGERQEVSADKIISDNRKGINMYRLERAIQGMNHHIHGDYESTLLIKQDILGKAFMLFKTWMLHTTYSRFGGTKFDPNLLRTTKGRYRSLFKSELLDGTEIKFNRIVKILAQGMISRKAFKDLSDVDRVNLMRDLRELQMIITMSLIAMLLMSLKGDDDDEYAKRTLNILINLTTKTQADLMFYMNPNSMEQIINNALPIISTLGDFVAIVPAIGKTISGDPYYETGPWKDKSRVMVSTMRAFPIFGGGVKMWNYATNQYDFN